MSDPAGHPHGYAVPSYADMKALVSERVLAQVDGAQLGFHSNEAVRRDVYAKLDHTCRTELPPLHPHELQRLLQELMQDLFGLGPLEPLLADPTVTDILVNGPYRVYVERGGRLEPTPIRFQSEAHVIQLVHRIAASVGRQVDSARPMLDARLPDGSRVNAILPPLAVDGTAVSIRRFSRVPFTMDRMIEMRTMTPEMGMLLEAAIKARLNVIVSGGTGSGKTTLLNILSAYIPSHQRIVTIEDAAELRLVQEHVVRLETRPPDLEGQGAYSARDLLRNALRMRPDRIIIGECRGPEALDMLQAMNTGHEGSMTTVHANAPRDALSRLETMMLMGVVELPVRALRQQIGAAVDLIVQVMRLEGGRRKITSISEVIGLEQDIVTMQELFSFRRLGVDANDAARGQFECSGVRPKAMAQLEAAGQRLPPNLFQQRVLMRD
jgi:pilus assembly protein CpaF